MTRDIVEKKVPLSDSPKTWPNGIIETSEKGSDEVELSEIGQGNKWFDAPDNTRHFEQFHQFAIHWHFVDIEAESVVIEAAADIKKITGTTAEIENALAFSIIQSELANTVGISPDPTFKIQELRRFI